MIEFLRQKLVYIVMGVHYREGPLLCYKGGVLAVEAEVVGVENSWVLDKGHMEGKNI